ncbi:hypothetical protein GQ53DRAFT_458244 [Thozetella sp. PMI_491]|nr:hypothetical protein GQ53DRAFT_458244 [Thozetella sp. PMI_491]
MELCFRRDLSLLIYLLLATDVDECTGLLKPSTASCSRALRGRLRSAQISRDGLEKRCKGPKRLAELISRQSWATCAVLATFLLHPYGHYQVVADYPIS